MTPEPDAEADTDAEAGPTADSEPEVDADADADPDAEVDPDTDAEADPDAGVDAADLDPERRRRLRFEAEEFLYREAQLLDDRRLTEWHDRMVTEGIDYRVPVRTTREREADSEFSETAFFMKEDHGTLGVRTERMENDFAWSEDPPSRTRRFVTNVRVEAAGEGWVTVRNNLQLARSKSEESEPELLTAERRDRLRRVDGDWRLDERLVRLDHTVLGTSSLSVLL